MRIDLKEDFYLTPICDGDQAAYVEHFSDKETTEQLIRVPYPYTIKDAESWVRHCLDTTLKTSFALRRVDGFLVGGVGLILHTGVAAHRAELGYWVAKPYRDRGLATAAALAMIRYGFGELGLRRIEAGVFCHNEASRRVLEKTGLQREGTQLAYYLKNDVLIDVDLYAILEVRY